MRVGVIGLQHESNSFLPCPTRLRDFENDLLLSGEAVRTEMRDAHHEVGGFFEGLERAGIEAVPLFMARAVPSGVISAETGARLLQALFKAAGDLSGLDGLLVAPHGAAVWELNRDFDGHWLSRLRERLGPERPMICTLDPHANISSAMIGACDATIAYRTNPHLDQRQRGLEAAALMARTLAGEISPVQAFVPAGLAINIERQLTDASPCRELYDLAEDVRAEPGVLSCSIILGFPYSDVEKMGTAAIAVTDGDSGLAAAKAGRLTSYLWENRKAFVGSLIGIDEALAEAARGDSPVCLLDMGDNIGGGSPADSTHLAHAIRRKRMPDTFVCLYDPEAAAEARAAGIGQRVHLRMGGKTDDLHGEPFEAEVTVVSLHNGQFTESQPRHGGRTHYNMGSTAVVRTDDRMTIMLTSLRQPPASPIQLTSCGLDPAEFHLLVAKGVHLPVAAYRTVCKHFIRVNTPGATTADMVSLPYRHRPRPLFPFEEAASPGGGCA